MGVSPYFTGTSFPLILNLRHEGGRRITAAVSSGLIGALEISLYDVRGRLAERCRVRKHTPVYAVDLYSELGTIKYLPGGVYFVRIRQGRHSRCAKLVLTD
jgi:hypothetical protein